MGDDTEAYIQMANELFHQLQIPQYISYIDDLDSGAFVKLFRSLCGDDNIGEFVSKPRNNAENRHNLRVILRVLSEDVLQVSLSHISPEDIISGEKTAICNLLEIFQGLLEYMLNRLDDEEREPSRSSSTDSEKEVEKASFEYSTDKEKRKKLSARRQDDERSFTSSEDSPQPAGRIFDMNTSSFHQDDNRSPRQKSYRINTPVFVLDKKERCQAMNRSDNNSPRGDIVNEAVRQSRESLHRGDEIIDRAHKSRVTDSATISERCPAMSQFPDSFTTKSGTVLNSDSITVNGLKSKADEEYDKLRVHIKRVEQEASRVGHLAQSVAEQTHQQEAAQRSREVYLRRKLMEFMKAGDGKPPGITPKDPDPKDVQWFKDYSKMHQKPISRSRRTPVTVGKTRHSNRRGTRHRSTSSHRRRPEDVGLNTSLKNYVKDNKLRTNLIQQEAARAATEAAARDLCTLNNRHRLSESLRRQRERVSKELPSAYDESHPYGTYQQEVRKQGNALRYGQQWADLKREQIGRVYQNQLEDVAATERRPRIDHLYRKRENVMEKEKALRHLSSGRMVGGPARASVLKPSGSFVKPAPRIIAPKKVKPPFLKSESSKSQYRSERPAVKKRGGKYQSHSERGYPDSEDGYSDEDRDRMSNGYSEEEIVEDKESWRSSQLAYKSLPEHPNDEELLEFLLGEFPYLHLSKQTVRELWNKAIRQASIMSRTNYESRHQKCKEQILVEEAHRRQQILSEMLRKEVTHNQRLRDHREQQAARRAILSRDRDLRQQHSRCKKYYDEFVLKMQSKMLKKRTREEQIFRKLFQEALKLQRERLQDMRKYARDMRSSQSVKKKNELESLENFYRDRFRMLADSLADERGEISAQEQAQNKLLQQMKRELRSKLEADIGNDQNDIVRTSEDPFFRQLDANRSLKHLRSLRYKP